ETNTFSPVPTPLGRFASGQAEPFRNDEVVRAFQGTNSGVAAFLDLAREAGAEIVTPIAASARPSGPVETAAYEAMCDAICEAVAQGCDACLLDLHGAMVTDDLEDGEGALLARLRGIAPDLPIAVALDMHTNLYPAMVENCSVLAGFQTYPHIDNYDTAMRAGRPLFAMLRGEATPTMAWGQRPMLPHVMCQGTGRFPNKDLQARTRAMEQEPDVLAATLFVGFPHADISQAGLSAVVVTDNNPEKAERYTQELLDFAWKHRADWVYRIEPLERSLARAAAVEEGPVVLLDHYDNAASGGTMDTMTVLGAILDAGLENVAAYAICDPRAVAEMIAAGVGNEVTVSLGGKMSMPSLGLQGQPREVTGRVKLIHDGRYRNQGPASTGVLFDQGPTVVLDTGKVEIVVISRQNEPNDEQAFRALGIDPTRKRFLMLKSRVHFRAGFEAMAKDVIECAGTGVCTSDYGQLTFKNVRRPIYPLDEM
ncbi:MAG: M81 family metallopeptidase, partial [Alphaproteobacteria bacterium]|nr:M81 family metallopeptidase [Alphaproteobacteria bacterium]